MNTLQGDKTIILEALLPEDPENGTVVTLPEGQTVGGANVIQAVRGGKVLATISQMAPVRNSSGKYEATRAASCTVINPGDILRILGWQYTFKSLKFVESFGWMGHETDPTPLSLMDKHVRVLDTSLLGPDPSGIYLYEKLCLSVIREGEKTHAQPASYTPPTTSRDSTPISFGTTLTRGGSSSPSGANTAPGSSSDTPRRPTLIDAGDGSSE